MAAGPRYKKIEFCNSPKALWGKLHSCRYDWLGVKDDGRTFVVGSPQASGFGSRMNMTVSSRGAKPGRYVARMRTFGDPGWNTDECADEAGAREKHALLRRQAEELGESSPVLVQIELIIDGVQAEFETFVTRPSTYR